MLEEVKWSDEGRLCTNGPGTYQIPRFSDIPSEFNVSLLKGMSNPHAIHSSKVTRGKLNYYMFIYWICNNSALVQL